MHFTPAQGPFLRNPPRNKAERPKMIHSTPAPMGPGKNSVSLTASEDSALRI